MSAATGYPVFDADNHLYETEEAFTKFLPDRYRDAVQYVEVRGRKKIAVNSKISEYIPNPTFEVVARPGAMEDYYRIGNPKGLSRRELFGDPIKSPPAFREPVSRLAMMNEQGLDRTLMFPTLASVLEERMKDDPNAAHAIIHSFNQWLHETWTFNYQDRIFATPVITLPIVDKAIEELEWVLERGAKVILVRPAPPTGFRGPRSFALPEFDPFWKRVVEADILVALHSSDSGYERFANEWIGGDEEFLPFKPNAFRMLSSWRPIEDAVASLVCHGALARFPQLKIAVIENGASWVAPLLRNLADLWKKMPQDFPENPVEALKRNIHISPFWEEDMGAIAEMLGPDRVLFGSDFPHPEGLGDPVSYTRVLDGLPDDLVRKIMGDNLARLMNVDNTPIVSAPIVSAPAMA